LWSKSWDGELVRKAGFDKPCERYKISLIEVTLNQKRMGSPYARLRGEGDPCCLKRYTNIE
jgi:hypothetical protein